MKNLIRKLLNICFLGGVLFFAASAFGQAESKTDRPKLIRGDVFIIEKGATALPKDFSKLIPITSIFVSEINVPSRSWNNGFPDLPEIYEWFAIEYRATVSVGQDGNFKFRLVSDDGSRLYIDNKLIVDNDGTHMFLPASGSAKLTPGAHSFKVQFFQGPRYEAGIQLFVKKDGAKEAIFPGDDLEISAAADNNSAAK